MGPTSIKRINIVPLNIPLEAPFKIAIGIKNSIQNVLVTIQLENGMEGYGEAAPLEPINGENQATAMATIKSCEEFLIGEDVRHYKEISVKLKSVFWAQAAARCAIEMAIIDAYTKTLNVPLYQFFGGAQRTIETDFTIGIVSAETAKNSATNLAQRGYHTIKTKVGNHIDEDIARILAIKEGAPKCEIMIDANQGYSTQEALQFLEKLKENKVTPALFEQPVLKHDLEGMRFIKNNTSIPIAADETVFTSADATAVAKSECADLINIKLMKSGIVEALEIAAIARKSNIRLMIGCMLETKLGLGCAAHFAAGLGGFEFVDLDPHLYPDADPFIGGPDFVEPFYNFSATEVGIGITIK